MKKSLIKYQVKIFDIATALDKLKEEKIKIYNLTKIDEFSYTFLVSPFCKNRLKKVFLDPKVVNEVGLIHIFENFFRYKTTLIALILAIILFFLMSNKIWKIEISGDSTSLYPLIEETLKQNKITKGISKIDSKNLLMLEEKMLYQLKDEIEWIELRNSGSVLKVKFLKRRTSMELEQLKGNLYATKNGVILSFDIKSGEKVVKINDYVKKGDLLVKDIVTTDQNEDIYVGTLGSVYAYTWYIVDSYINIDADNYDETQVFLNLLFRAKEEVSKNLTENEYIYKESVLLFEKNGKIVTMKVHFTCVEDITKE